MQKYAKVPFLFFFVAAAIGLLLRWNSISPVSGFKFSYWLHAHSHLMFLGWVFNLLSLAFIHDHIPEEQRKKYLTLFVFIQALLGGMLISFPMQGYGLYSITISTLHTIAVVIFSYWFFHDTKKDGFDPSRWFARISLIFFLMSSLGPFTLAPLMVNGLSQTKWYYFAVYYYLHFQYNGVFTFGLLSLFFGLLKEKRVTLDQSIVKRFAYLMLISCFLGYSLSTLWANPGIIFNVLGLFSALIQLLAFISFVKIIRSIPVKFIRNISALAKILFSVSFLSFAVKVVLQTFSAHPFVAWLAYETRSYVMAYLHLVLLGMISTFLLAWSVEMKWIRKPPKSVIVLFLIGFVAMELLLINPILLDHSLINAANLLFLFSGLLVFAIGMFALHAFNKESR